MKEIEGEGDRKEIEGEGDRGGRRYRGKEIEGKRDRGVRGREREREVDRGRWLGRERYM